MILRIKEIAGPSGPAIALCDEGGEPLPDQLSLVIKSTPDDIAKVEVVFAIGDQVVLEKGDRSDRRGVRYVPLKGNGEGAVIPVVKEADLPRHVKISAGFSRHSETPQASDR